MHFSLSKVILELAFLTLRHKALLFEGDNIFSELNSFELRKLLISEWRWSKKQVKQAIQHWIEKDFIYLDNNLIYFKFTDTNRNKPLSPRITGIDYDFHIQ